MTAGGWTCDHRRMTTDDTIPVEGSGPDVPTVPVPEGVQETDLPQPEEFPTTRLRRGYVPEQVDELIEEVFDAVRSGEPAPEIAEATFDGTVLKTGYVEGAVDEYLDQLSEAIGQEPTPPPEK